jgi:hypothetical protein
MKTVKAGFVPDVQANQNTTAETNYQTQGIHQSIQFTSDELAVSDGKIVFEHKQGGFCDETY